MSFALLIAACHNPAPPAAEGGKELLPAALQARVTVEGAIESVDKLDLHGYSAHLKIDRVLTTGAPVRPGVTIRLAWEELASGRGVRLSSGDRVIAALGPAPGGSLWRQRLLSREESLDVFTLAGNGEGFLRNPSNRDGVIVERYLRLEPADRQATAGVHALTSILVDGSAQLPLSAIALFASIDGLDTELDRGDADRWIAVVGDPRRDIVVRRALLTLMADRHIVKVSPQLRALAQPGFDLEADTWESIARLAGGLSPAEVERLLASPQADLRTVGVRWARSDDFKDRLLVIARTDPAPPVRATAIETALQLGGATMLDQVAVGLVDPDTQVRVRTATAIGLLGAAVIPALEGMIGSGSVERSQGAILALAQTGPAGREALLRISATNPDEKMRNLALLALGRIESHKH